MGSVSLAGDALLVKPEVAAKQMGQDAAKQATAGTAAIPPGPEPQPHLPLGGRGVSPDPGASRPAAAPSPKRFHGSVELDPMRLSRDAGKIADEVVQHISKLVGARVDVTLEIRAEIPEGAPENVVRTVTENCQTLRFKDHGFEER